MKLSTYFPQTKRSRFAAAFATCATLFSAGLLVALVGGAQAASTAIPLGAADSFVVLAGAGDHEHRADHARRRHRDVPDDDDQRKRIDDDQRNESRRRRCHAAGKTDLITAYNNAAGQGPTSPIAADLGGQTLTPASTTLPRRSD